MGRSVGNCIFNFQPDTGKKGISQWTECTAEIETATASFLKLHHVVNLLPLLSPEVT